MAPQAVWKEGGLVSYRWFVTLLLRDASWLLYCIVGHLNPTSAPSILLVLLEPHYSHEYKVFNILPWQGSQLSYRGPATHSVDFLYFKNLIWLDEHTFYAPYHRSAFKTPASVMLDAGFVVHCCVMRHIYTLNLVSHCNNETTHCIPDDALLKYM